MNLKFLIITVFLAISSTSFSQSALNFTDSKGMKQGKWIKKYPNDSVMYVGIFKDNHPVGEFRRYYEDHTLKSILQYSPDGNQADAILYHPNGFVSSKGKYVNQLKEGKWQFFSALTNGYRVSEEYYSKNIRNGTSLKFYPDSTVAEKVNYVNDIKQGEWVLYYPNGKISVKASYRNDKINGPISGWFDSGTLQFTGQYKDDDKDGKWVIYNRDGSVRYQLEYKMGYTDDHQMDIKESEYLDSLEQNKGKIADPEKSGIIK